ncbi:MAG TPA: STAS domain-containing protein [Thermoanaerobaculia bacterium]|jgi:anti-sigma B factor antagonist
MKFVESKEGSTVILRIEGTLKMGEASRELGARLGSVAETRKGAVVDMSLLEAIDSTGIGVLVGAWKKFHDAGTPLILAAPSRRVMSSLHISNLDTLFTIRETVKEALAEAISRSEEPTTP